MPPLESVSDHLSGMYRDRLYDPQGNLIWDRGWQRNAIVLSCRQLLAGLMRNATNTFGIQGLQVGRGRPEWDQTGTPLATETQTALEDPAPVLVPLPSPPPAPTPINTLQFDYVDETTGDIVAGPTRRLQIRAILGPGSHLWPSETPPTSTVREFGLVGRLNNTNVLVNYVRHPAIVKDPASRLERTIWLVF
ncbi:hypothetical protein ACKFKG_30165 [Phormidesmis sp. 146-35]